MGITWLCEIFLTTMFEILIVVPIAVILITVEIMTRRRVVRQNRVSISQPYNPYALACL